MKSEDINRMYDYNIGNGKTIYQILGEKYYPELHGDFSTQSLFINFLYFIDKDIHGFSTFKPLYDKEFKKLSSEFKTILDLQVTSYDEELKKVILEKLKLVSSKNAKYESIEEYLDYAKKNLHNPNSYGVQEILISTFFNLIDSNKENRYRTELLGYVYSTQVMNQLKTKYGNGRTQEKNLDWEEMQFINKILTNGKYLKEYDDFLSSQQIDIERYSKKLAIKTSRIAKRKKYVIDDVNESMTTEKQYYTSISEGTFRFKINEYNSPKIILCRPTTYSKEGDENQFVIAEALGSCSYSTMFNRQGDATYNSYALELVAVTRIDKSYPSDIELNERENKKTYFILMPINRIKMLDGDTEKLIPADLQDYYANVYFSDYYLENVEKNNFRFAGNVLRLQESDSLRINATYKSNGEDYRAAIYASKYPIEISEVIDKKRQKINKATYKNINDYLRFSNLIIKHLTCLSFLEDRPEYQNFIGKNNKQEKGKEWEEEVK